MPSSRQEVQSLLTEHFRYTPLTLIDDIINTVNTILYRAVDAVEEGLTNTPAPLLGFPAASLNDAAHPATTTTTTTSTSPDTPDTSTLSNAAARDRDEAGNPLYPAARAEIENGVHQLETLLESSVDNYFDRLEIYILRNILTVPDGLERWMRLGHYRGLDVSRVAAAQGSESTTASSSSSSSSSSSPEELVRLRRKVQETVKLRRRLREERRRNEVMLGQLRAVLLGGGGRANGHDLSFLMRSQALDELRAAAGQGRSQQPLTAETQKAVACLPQLQQTAKMLREAQQRGISAPTRAGRDEERSAYVEGAVRTAVGDRKGESAAVGQKMSRDEVSAIESIAKGFGENGG